MTESLYCAHCAFNMGEKDGEWCEMGLLMREGPHECPQHEDAQPELEYGEEYW